MAQRNVKITVELVAPAGEIVREILAMCRQTAPSIGGSREGAAKNFGIVSEQDTN